MRTSGIALSSLPARYQEQVAGQLYGSPVLQRQGLAATGVPQKQTPAIPHYPLSLWIDYHVPSLNTVLNKSHWAITNMKGVAKESLNTSLLVVNYRPRVPASRIHVLITCYVLKPRDADNPCPKFLIDAMRYAGLLRNDDPGSMVLTVHPDVKVPKKKLQGTKVVLVEALP